MAARGSVAYLALACLVIRRKKKRQAAAALIRTTGPAMPPTED
jgi:hypothetical protein